MVCFVQLLIILVVFVAFSIRFRVAYLRFLVVEQRFTSLTVRFAASIAIDWDARISLVEALVLVWFES